MSHSLPPKTPVRKLIVGRWVRYPPIDSVKVPMMKTVGPTTKRKNTRRAAATALALESHLMPLSMPLTAEMTKQRVSTAMTTAAAVVP